MKDFLKICYICVGCIIGKEWQIGNGFVIVADFVVMKDIPAD